MADNSLNTTTGSGSQSATQSPQSSVTSTDTNSAASSGVQPSVNQDALLNQQGIQITNTQPNTISLGDTTSSSTSTPVNIPNSHHINPALAGFSIALFVVAIVLFWVTSRPVKTTT
ncbi:MAG: hypothetical protein ACXWLH_05555 [Candidatus Saccharimonadales bacterium]